MREIVDFPANVPVEVALAYGEGKIVEGRFGSRVMYSLVGDRVMFLDMNVSQKINELGIKAREPLCICKHAAKKGQPAEWRVWSLDPVQPVQARASVAAPAPAAVAPITPSRQTAPPTNTNNNGNGSIHAPSNGAGHSTSSGSGRGFASEEPAQAHLGWAQFLLQQTNALADVYAAALNYASTKYGSQVKADDVRCFLTMAYNAQSKGQGPNVA